MGTMFVYQVRMIHVQNEGCIIYPTYKPDHWLELTELWCAAKKLHFDYLLWNSFELKSVSLEIKLKTESESTDKTEKESTSVL
jgi:hypothetical protein